MKYSSPNFITLCLNEKISDKPKLSDQYSLKCHEKERLEKMLPIRVDKAWRLKCNRCTALDAATEEGHQVCSLVNSIVSMLTS
jgi:hypothetical protein